MQLDELYRKKLEAGLSPRSVQMIHATAYKALKQAVRWRLVRSNVAPPKSVKRDMQPLTKDQTQELLRTAKANTTETIPPLCAGNFYVLKSGCQWRLLPHDFPRWPTVYHYFRAWRIDGTWERINRAIRRRLRVRLKRDPQPSAGVVDSQSVKSTGVGREDRGCDGNKKIKGRIRHILVDLEKASCSKRRSTAPK